MAQQPKTLARVGLVLAAISGALFVLSSEARSWSDLATAAATGYCMAAHPYIAIPDPADPYTEQGFEIVTSPGFVGATRRNYVYHRGPITDYNNWGLDKGLLQSCEQACAQWGNGGYGVPLHFRWSKTSAPITDGVGDVGDGDRADAQFTASPHTVVAGMGGWPHNWHENDVAQADYCCCQLVNTPPPPSEKVCLDFESPLALGTRFGSPAGQNPGDIAISQNGVTVSLEKFIDGSGGSQFNEASIDNRAVPGGSNQSMRTNNINLLFDVSGLGFKPGRATVDYLDLGGSENITANGDAPFVGDIGGAPATAGGVNLAVTQAPLAGGKSGVITWTGALKSVLVGGQEFWIDQFCVYPEKGT